MVACAVALCCLLTGGTWFTRCLFGCFGVAACVMLFCVCLFDMIAC